MQVDLTPTELATIIAALRGHAGHQRALSRQRKYAGPNLADVRQVVRKHADQAESLADQLDNVLEYERETSDAAPPRCDRPRTVTPPRVPGASPAPAARPTTTGGA